jgi:hypothetical protein
VQALSSNSSTAKKTKRERERERERETEKVRNRERKKKTLGLLKRTYFICEKNMNWGGGWDLVLWLECPLQNPPKCLLKFIATVIGFRGGAFKKQLDHEGFALMNAVCGGVEIIMAVVS